MEMISEKWIVIFNPKSGKKQLRKQVSYLLHTLKDAQIVFDFRFTRFAGHASSIGKYWVELGYTNFLVIGGDGTINELINGIFRSNLDDYSAIKIALVPRGTGNDWGRFWKLTKNYKQSIEVFLNKNTQSIDIGYIDYIVEESNYRHYFINSVGFGLDAHVANLAHKLKKYLGSHAYLYTLALLLTVFRYRSHVTKIQTEIMTVTESLFTMNVANGCYSGGGMKQNPLAVPYDGLLDTMFARKPSFKDILLAVPMLFNGKILNHPMIHSFRNQDIRIQTSRDAIVETDGIVFNAGRKFHIQIIPKAIQMIVP